MSAVSQLTALAERAFRNGAFEEAEKLCRQALAEDDNQPTPNMMLGNLRARRGEWAEAEACFRKVVEREPNAYEPLEWLASIARETGRIEEAWHLSQRLMQMRPGSPGAYMSLALCHMKEGRTELAVPLLEQAVRLAPAAALFRYNLASALKDCGRPEEALCEYRQALTLEPGLGKALLAASGLLIELRRSDEAISLLRNLAQLEPNSFTFTQLAHGLAEAEKYDEAEAYIRKAIELDATNADAHAALGIHLLHLGRFEDAISGFRQAIAVDPERTVPYFGITRCKNMGIEDQVLLAKLEAMASETYRSSAELREIHYAIGKTRDDLGEYEAAFGHFIKANELSKGIQLAHRPFDKDATRWHNSRMIATFRREFFESHQELGVRSEVPIFIVGMVRSGTTLCEQVVSSHPEVSARGELRFWTDDRAQAAIGDVLDGKVCQPELKKLAEDYFKLLEEGALSPETRRATDKMPLNYLSLGLIHLLFPNARIIHCMRNPLDTCVSIFVTPYREAPDFFYDRHNIVEGYREYQRLMAHWRAVIPKDRFHEVRYEDLVTNAEVASREMIHFCGLSWDEACLRPETNRRSVRTPSAWQVRQPLYGGSIGRWQKYEPWLGPLRDLL